MKNFVVVIGLCLNLTSFYTLAQTDEDALRYSQLFIGGTARYLGVGGAFGALGADFGAISNNPAGIGLFRSSELSFSPSVTGITLETNFLNSINNDTKLKLNISNFGIVIASDLTKNDSENKWKRLNIGFGANRVNDFNSSTYYRGFNANNSLVDFYLEELNSSGTIPSEITDNFPFSSALVWESYLVNPDVADSNAYTSVIPNGNVQQDKLITEDGSVTEYLFSIGSNYDDQLYLGASIGMPSLHYSYSSSYVESDVNEGIPDFSSFQLYDNLTTDGVGFNGKFGIAYRLNEWVRFGGSIHTPTIYFLHDAYSSTINTDLENSQFSYSTLNGSYNYNLVTPWRAIGSIALFYKEFGFLSFDYEFVDYAAMQYKFKKFSSIEEKAIENSLNETIDLKYAPASNIRIGAEIAYNMLRFRAGAGLYGSPFQEGVGTEGYDYSRKFISGGLGVKAAKFSIDAAYVHSTSNEFYQPYTLDPESETVPGVGIKNTTGNVVLSLGYKF